MFAILEAVVLSRRRGWQERELAIDAYEPEALAQLDPADELASREFLRRVNAAIRRELSPRQRQLLTVVLAGVPIDVLPERLSTTRGPL